MQIQTAANNRWPMTMDQRNAAVDRLLQIISDPKSNGRLVVSATKALAAMDKLNLDEQPRQTHSLNLNLNVGDRKSELAKRIESLKGSLSDSASD
ncbi:hypothetical protein [Aporhodopirellula aestuarii]|uniref:Uncharacterized protein n=1 Tax=Aporhodopirellula aestuarii TaxID=2950107 RepID=A0ABT0TYJ4_9BACT|nr:hypothetical protein [Aporhodopirellula aestuarii]MCM2369651.1 hypothetical protein [Aporhodopirellula aestuarii]